MLNVLMLGVGQCGNRILDAVNKQAFGGSRLAKYYSKQRFPSRVETIAINTAINDLKELKFTAAKDRLHVPNLHGVGANRSKGKQGFWENQEMILEEIEKRGDFDLIFIMTSVSGGTGSSFSPLMIHELKKRYKNATIVPIAVLPFREEGTIYLQNAAFCLREMIEVEADGMILVDNQYLKRFSGDIASAYDRINTMVAQRLLFLIEALDSEMLSVTDLGDFKTVMSGGLRMGTLGYYQADKKSPSVRAAIKNSLREVGLLYPANVDAGEAGRAMIVIQGSREYLDVDEITKEIESLTETIGHVFKGIVIKKGEPRVLSVLSLERAPGLVELYEKAKWAIQEERERKDRAKSELYEAFEQINDLEEIY